MAAHAACFWGHSSRCIYASPMRIRFWPPLESFTCSVKIGEIVHLRSNSFCGSTFSPKRRDCCSINFDVLSNETYILQQMVADSCASGFAPGDAVKLKLALAIQLRALRLHLGLLSIGLPQEFCVPISGLQPGAKGELPEFPIGASTGCWRGQAA